MEANKLAEARMQTFQVRRSHRSEFATIWQGEKKLAQIEKGDGLSFLIKGAEGESWAVDPRVRGQILPFSLNIVNTMDNHPVLTVIDHVFRHNGVFYMFTGFPEGRNPGELKVGVRYICRMDSLMYEDVFDIDPDTFGRLRRMYRGKAVAELSGLGSVGHTILLAEELWGIAIPLATASYILYSTV
jgi:hypothetical protein